MRPSFDAWVDGVVADMARAVFVTVMGPNLICS